MKPGRLGIALLGAALVFGGDGSSHRPLIPEPGVFSALLGIYCTSAANCWAVGTYNPRATTGLNEVLHWNGARWARVTVPSPAGTGPQDVSLLQSVRCAKATDCWAVGIYERGLGTIFSQALHWNGRKWSSAQVPELGGNAKDSITTLDDVACPSTATCWAVGEFGRQGANFVLRNEMLRWNGKKWALARTPQPAGTAVDDLNQLLSIRCPSAARCLAVGDDGTVGAAHMLVNQVLRWNGKSWTAVSVPSPGGTGADGDFSRLNGLACSSAGNCWAVGTYSPTASVTRFNQVLHWNGSAWSAITVPEPGGTADGASQELLFAACGSPTNCWAVGDFAPAGGGQVTVNQALHWDGGMWSVVDTPDPAGVSGGDANILSALRCPSPRDCWAVGVARMSDAVDFNQALHWGGVRWSVR